MKYCIEIAPEGADHHIEMVEKLSVIVLQNWKQLYLGATRLGCAIEADYYAPQRVQIGKTRLHQGQGWLGTSWDGSPYVPPRGYGVKYADGWKYDGLVGPTDAQLMQTVADIQTLFDESSKEFNFFRTLVEENK